MNYFDHMALHWDLVTMNWIITHGEFKNRIIQCHQGMADCYAGRFEIRRKDGQFYFSGSNSDSHRIKPHEIITEIAYFAGSYHESLNDAFLNLMTFDPIVYQVNHLKQTVEVYQFDPELIRLGRNIYRTTSNLIILDNIYEIANCLLDQPSGHYLLCGDHSIDGLRTIGNRVAEISRDDSILLKLYDPDITIYNHEAV